MKCSGRRYFYPAEGCYLKHLAAASSIDGLKHQNDFNLRIASCTTPSSKTFALRFVSKSPEDSM